MGCTKLFGACLLLFGLATISHPVCGVPTAGGDARVARFLDQHCVECHDADTKKGQLDLTALPFKLSDADTFAMWVKVHDRVGSGEMPPKKKERPSEGDRAAAELPRHHARPVP